MDQIIGKLGAIWRSADPRRRITMLAGAAAFALILVFLIRAATTPSMALLYSGLESSAANGVIEGLERQGLAYEVRGDAIYVAASERDRARIRLAGEGLPAAGAAGYELLDGLSGFGTTSEMFDAAYWRAKEGELARTVLASQHVVRARVHIAQSRRRPFETPTPVTASVTVTTSSGEMSRSQAEAIRHLVGSAVAGLSNSDVAVIDQERGVILKAGDQDGETNIAEDAAAQAEALRLKVTRLLEARVGVGAVTVEVAVDTARDSETVRERILDPNGKIAVHTDKEESADNASGSADAVTVASNLPAGDVEGGGDSSTRQATKSRERTNFEVSETVRETVSPPGRIERISVAVLVDGIRDPVSGDWAPRSAEELDALNGLVKSAIGFSEARGDAVTLETLEFSKAPLEGEAAGSGVGALLAANAGLFAQVAALAIAALAIGLFVLKPILAAPASGAPALAPPEDDGLIIDAAAVSDTGEDAYPAEADGEVDPGMAGFGAGEEAIEDVAIGGGGDFGFEPLGGFGGGMVAASAEDGSGIRAQVEAAIASHPERAIEILQEWLDEGRVAPEAERVGA